VLDFREALQQGPVADRHQPRRKALRREPRAQLGPDPGRLSRSQGDDRGGGYRSSSLSST
jgi:hypothetical protein